MSARMHDFGGLAAPAPPTGHALLRQQREASLAALSGGIAHDLNRMLHGVMLRASALRESARTDSDAARHAAGILSAARNMADLTARLMSLARGDFDTFRPVSVNELIQDILTLLHPARPAGVRVRAFLSRDLWMVDANPPQLMQAFFNLAINACEATSDCGTICFVTENTTFELPWGSAVDSQHAPGEFIHAVVADSGSGISEEIRGRMFEPGVSTKGEGRGLGLSALRDVVRNHRGGVMVTSDPGRGTAFHLYFPRSANNGQ